MVEVNDDYTLITVDVVGNPSFGDAAIFDSYIEAINRDAGKQILMESATRVRREFRKNYILRTGFGSFDKNILIESLSRGI